MEDSTLCRVLHYYLDDVSYDFIERESFDFDSEVIDMVSGLEGGRLLYTKRRRKEIALIDENKLYVLLFTNAEDYDISLEYVKANLPNNLNVTNLRNYRAFRSPRRTR